jgi:hypothetical protein
MINIVFYKLFQYFEIFIFYLIAIKRDVTFFIKMAYLIIKSILYKHKNLTTADIFLENVKKNPNKACIIFEDKTWTFQDVNMNKLIN